MSETEDTGPGRRRHVRYHVSWPAECIDAQGFTWKARVLDHSLGGLGLENCPQLAVDQVIRVKLESIAPNTKSGPGDNLRRGRCL